MCGTAALGCANCLHSRGRLCYMRIASSITPRLTEHQGSPSRSLQSKFPSGCSSRVPRRGICLSWSRCKWSGCGFPAVAAVEVVAMATAALPVRQQEMFPGGDGSLREQWLPSFGVDRSAPQPARPPRGGECATWCPTPSRNSPIAAIRWTCWTTVFGVAAGGRRRRPNFPRVRCVCCVARRRCPACRTRRSFPRRHSRLPDADTRSPAPGGPERIETGWWRGHTIGRDYYCVETAAGHRYWLFRRLRDGRWFLHGCSSEPNEGALPMDHADCGFFAM